MNIFRKLANKVLEWDGAKLERGYREVTSIGGVNSDWRIDTQGEDSDVWRNAWALTARVRDLFRTNPLYTKYREVLWANVFGEAGIMLRMKIKEQEDRVIHTPDEKAALLAHEHRINRLRKRGMALPGSSVEHYRAMKVADMLETSERTLAAILERQATVQVGEPDVFANQLIEKRWAEWQRAEYSDSRGSRDYKVNRQLRLISAVRDGDVFIRMIRTPRVNKFGFSLQIINSEWCDRFYNCELQNGNVVRMGIEYQNNEWGIGKPVAYYFIKRQPNDWQFTNPGMTGIHTGSYYERVPAEEIVHYCRVVDADSTRPAPWVASTIPKGRQLDQYELYEVISAREEAAKTGFFWSDIVPEGGMTAAPIDPRTGVPTSRCGPGEAQGLPFGVKYQERNPTHPSGNFENFRKGMLRSICAGMPGSDYSTMANDYEAINFSAGRLQRLDSNEMFFLLQRNDIDKAENIIFENWLDMGLITGAIPLPLAKFDKFNSKKFQGRRFGGVDEVKEVTAAALRVANNMSSLQHECAQLGRDFEDVAMERSEELMILEELGVDSLLTVQAPIAAAPAEDTADGEQSATDSKKPKKSLRVDEEEEKEFREMMQLHRIHPRNPLAINGNGH